MAALEPGSEFAGHRIEAVAGRGGMGVVYRARDLRLDRLVALKLIAPELAQDPGFRERFELESRITASLDHANVIQIYAAGESDGQLYITMRYVAGTDMRALIQREGRLEPARTARIVDQVASALDAAHARGLVHRDVKPGNVLMASRDERDHVYLTDFGLTKSLSADSGRTRVGTWVGTLDYVAPEQLRGGSVDARADVYALGCVIYEALVGHTPFQADSDEAKMFAHVYTEPPALGPGLERYDEIVSRAMAKQPDERFPSAGDLARATMAAAEGSRIAEPERSVARGTAAPPDAGAPPAPPVPVAYPAVPPGAPPPSYAPDPVRQPWSAPPPPSTAWPPPPAPGRSSTRGLLTYAAIGAGIVLVGTLIAVLLVTGLR